MESFLEEWREIVLFAGRIAPWITSGLVIVGLVLLAETYLHTRKGR